MAPLSSRKIALNSNETFYASNNPCLRGHLSKRYTNNGQCIQCLIPDAIQREQFFNYTTRNRLHNETVLIAQQIGSALYKLTEPCLNGHVDFRKTKNRRCLTCLKEGDSRRFKRYYRDNKEKILLKSKEYRQTNVEKRQATTRNWRQAHKEEKRLERSLRRARKLARTPAWSDLTTIKNIYSKCPPNMQVDHIIPLAGKLVSGLHVPNNLQYMQKFDNQSKGNRFEPYTESINER